MLQFVINIQKFSPDICDSFENTIFHLKSFPLSSYPSRLAELCDCESLNKQNKEGNTPLHIACATGNLSMQRFLIRYEKCSKSISKQNVYGHTPLYYAKSRDMINYLIMNGADPKEVASSASVQKIIQTFEKVKGENPLNPTVTVLVLGNSMAGKTTLIRSLTKAYNWEFIQQPSVGQIRESDVHALGEKSQRTAGIEISEYKVFEDDEVRLLFYDFAGHPEFQSTHLLLLQNLLSSGQSSETCAILFLIVLDVTQHDKLTQLMYWARFIENCESSYAIGKPEIIVVGRHIDALMKELKPTEPDVLKKSVRNSLNKMMESISLEFVENPILLDCREPLVFDLQKVQMLLSKSTRSLKERANLDIRNHLLFAFLYQQFADKPVKLSALQKSLKEKKFTEFQATELSFTKNTLVELLKSMHYRQHILLIGLHSNDSPEADFWILTAKARSLMFQNINGVLFAGDEFDRHVNIKSNVGVLSSSMLKKEFPDVDYTLLHQFLEYSELCRKITDTDILDLIEGRTSDLTEPQVLGVMQNDAKLEETSNGAHDQHDDCVDYFFFPGLVKETKHVHIWKPNEDYGYASGWSLECTKDSFFNALFLQVLLLRLVFQFATCAIVNDSKLHILHRRCVIWKNGVFWSIEGVEMLVEVVNQNQTVNVLVRCLEGAELEAVKLRSAVLKEVFDVKVKHCPKTEAVEFVLLNPSYNDHSSLAEPVQKVAMKDIASAVIKGSRHVKDNLFQHHLINKSLLCFEPYVGIGDEILSQLFDIDTANEAVSEEFLSCITDLQIKAGAQLQHTDDIVQSARKAGPIVYQDLRKLFDMYSVFHGRNPKAC